jgi:decaprenyl-phosphate phosphoribosyltransferase
MKKYLKLMRVKHYIKNILIFLPLFFSQNLFNESLAIKTIISFLSFCLMSSCVYIFNDINDIEKDKKHPIKKSRPIASGEISKRNGIILFFILLFFSILLNFLANKSNVFSYIYLLFYLFINFLYSKCLKNIAIVDIVILVMGFLLRIIYGASIINVSISSWLYLTIMSFSFYLGLGKRRNEMDNIGSNSRKVLIKYSRNFLDKNMYLCLGLTIVFYSLWCIDPHLILIHPQLIYTIPLVLIICMRYSLIIEGDSYGDPVDVLTKDKTLISLVLIYLVCIIFIFYLEKFGLVL